VKILLTIFLAVASLIPARAGETERSVNELIDKIRAELPEGWAVSYDKRYSELDIMRIHKTRGAYIGVQGPPGAKMESVKVGLIFFVMPDVPPAIYPRLKAENAPIEKEISQIWPGIEKLYDPLGKTFSAGTADQNAAIARYKELRKSLHQLPEYYFHNISLDRSRFGGTPFERNVLIELMHVETRIRGLLSRFEPE